MTEGPRKVAISRREILAAVGTIGTVGTISGVGTLAHLSDVEVFERSVLRAGALDLEIACADENCSTTPDGAVQFDFPDIEPGQSGTAQVELTHTGNPAWLWLGSTCPVTELERAIQVTVEFDRGCDGSVEKRYEGSLSEVLLELAQGVRVTDDCLLGEEVACLTLDWTFENVPGVEKYQGESLSFEFQFGAIQCRHNDGSVRPFPSRECELPLHGISFIEVWGCADDADPCECELIGKLELSETYATKCGDAGLQTDGISENHIDLGLYDLPEDDDCVDTGYDLLVTTATENADGETIGIAFELLDANGDPGPDLCKVVVKSTREEIVYEAADLAPDSNSTEGQLWGEWR